MLPEHDTVFLARGRVEVLRWGRPRPGRPTLVFLQGGPGDARLWRDFPARLAAATGCDALACGRSGQGGSDPRPLPRPLDELTDEAVRVLPEVVERCITGEYVLIGHSDGATIALVHAGQCHLSGFMGAVVEAPRVFVEEAGPAGTGPWNVEYVLPGIRKPVLVIQGRQDECATLDQVMRIARA